ncbi:Os06g0472600 [Oryza sativa Japonica Group]|uniref:Os06g0472600 protein n=1 Tax=Oryza sativa subsp. japonica TaxID=39947 RepID=C7J3E1_ORYSJ|nr:Os06g0472600 [Oryza sativa Japonica Group]|eukprot:NP_001174786.1 Os06g0472600 [Oryza sativa Japonica Group]
MAANCMRDTVLNQREQIEKFAVRFPQPCDAESFLNCVKVYTSGVLQDGKENTMFCLFVLSLLNSIHDLSRMFDTVVAAKEMTADKVEGAGKEIDITIKRGIMPSIKAGDHLPAKMHSLVLMEEAAVTLANLEIKGQMSWTSSIAVEQTGRLFGSQTTLIPSCCRRSAMVMAEPSAVGSLGVSAICWHTDIVVATRIAAGMKPWSAMPTGSPSEGASTHRLPVSDEQECYPASRRRRVLASPIRPCILLRAGELPDDSDVVLAQSAMDGKLRWNLSFVRYGTDIALAY